MEFTPQEPPSDQEDISTTIPLDEKQQQAQAAKAFQNLLKQATPRLIVTPALLALNALVFVAMAVSGVSLIDPSVEQLLDWGASFGPYIFNGEWWRLISAMFVHIGLLHIAFNMQALWRLGSLVERMYGNWTTLLIYLLSGVGGSLASLWVHADLVAAGASGAIFGVAGGLAVAVYRGELPLPPKVMQSLRISTLFFLGYNLLYGFGNTGIDNAAHIGGLATGTVCGWFLLRKVPRSEADPQTHLTRSLALSAGVLALAFATLIAKSGHPTAGLVKAEELLQAGQVDEALVEIEDALERQPDSAWGHFLRGFVYQQKGDLEEAIYSYTGSISLDPERPEAYFNRGIVYFQMLRLDDSLADFDRAIELNPADGDAYYLRGLVHSYKYESESAIADLEKALSLGLDEDTASDAESLLRELKP